MSLLWTPRGGRPVETMVRKRGDLVYAPIRHDVEKCAPRSTDPETFEREERDAWAYVVAEYVKHNGVSVEEAERACRRAREREQARKREESKL